MWLKQRFFVLFLSFAAPAGLFVGVGCLLLFLVSALPGCRSLPPGNLQSEHPVFGVWIAAPQHNNMLHSAQHIDTQLAKLKELGINTLFVCAWADNKTAFKSKVLLQNSSYHTLEDTWMFKDHVPAGSALDPLQYLIDQAHRQDMKVIFWFEYGFMAQWGKEPSPSDHPVLAARPHWMGIGNDGKPCSYNQSDYYYNSFHPEVQQFMLDLVAESLDLYPSVDGVQGDDRLPAAPANSGYDSTTVRLYREAGFGSQPPQDFRDEAWFAWRVEQLNNFAVRLQNVVKRKNKDYIMAFSPNPYPWCLENLMQDWPAWVGDGLADLLNVQCYRRDLGAYQTTVSEAFDYAAGAGLDKTRFAPGLLLGIASGKLIAPGTLDSLLEFNAAQGYGGHSFFYVKWLSEDAEFDAVLKKRQHAGKMH